MSLKTKNVFVTGGAQGLGKGYAEALLKLGAKVVVTDMNEETGTNTEKELIEKYGADRVLFLPLDVTNDAQFKEVFSKAVTFLGFVDLMINNVGIMDETKPELSIDINFTGMVRGTLIAEEHMRKDKGGRGGRIINCSSLSGTFTEETFAHPIYNGTKHAIRVFTYSLAIAPDIKEQGIEYGVMCPGPTRTAILVGMENRMRFGPLHMRTHMKSNMATLEETMSGFKNFVTLENLNGAVMEAVKGQCTFVRVVREEIGNTWPID